MQSMFLDQNEVKLEIIKRKKKMLEKFPCIWGLNNTLLNNYGKK